MVRPLIEFTPETRAEDVEVQENWLTRTTARAFAAAVSALLIATLVVNRSNEALVTDGTVAGSVLTSGTISLVDDDAGRALFDFSDLAPGRPIVSCLEVVYEGTILPVDMSLRSETFGDLGEFLDLSIVEGTGAGFESCDGFTPTTTLYSGTLATFAEQGPLDLGRVLNQGGSRSYRFTFDLQDEQEALGRSATADFVWEVTPS
ncbi:MAG: hypothetical protein ACR2P0_16360 [Acidimicrobiales bacterium]